MRQVMPHRNNIVADPDNCKSFLHKNAWNHSFGLTGDRLFQLDRAQIIGASKEIEQEQGRAGPAWRGHPRAKGPNASEFRSEYDGISRTSTTSTSTRR
jgi:hypothetical protein